MKKILVDGGYYDCEAEKYCFYITDHQGNNRVVADQEGNVLQRTDYYPFGQSFADSENPEAQPYKYNGKELDTKHGLNLYDYSTRQMDASLGRFTTVDPMAERKPWLSPYHYCSDNPINRIDADGERDRKLAPGEIPNAEHRGADVGKTMATIERTSNSAKIIGFSNEHYGSQKTFPEKISLSVSGKMRENSKIIGDISISVDAEFSNEQIQNVAKFEGVAGGYGNGAPENREYTVNNYQDRSPNGWYNKGMNKDGVGFSYNLNPQFETGRTDLRIHPDGNNEGTLGCVGLSGKAVELKDFVQILNYVLDSQKNVPTKIDIIKNPNNDGRKKKNFSDINE